MLHRDYVFEFAGIPQGGKSTIVNIVIHYLKSQEIPISEYRGGSRYSPLYNAPIADLNLWLACKSVMFVDEILESENAVHRIYLLDKGPIDRCIFTTALSYAGKVEPVEAEAITNFLTLPRVLNKLDGTFIFVTSPEIALRREYGNNSIKNQDNIQPGREVMNREFLSIMYRAVIDEYYKIHGFLPNVHLIDTEQYNEEVEETACFVFNTILEVIKEKEPQLVHIFG